MVRHGSRSDLEARLRVVGEQPSFVDCGPGHLQHRCLKFVAVVNFWPSKRSWNVQGRDEHRLIKLLEEQNVPSATPAAPSAVCADASKASKIADISVSSQMQDSTMSSTLLQKSALADDVSATFAEGNSGNSKISQNSADLAEEHSTVEVTSQVDFEKKRCGAEVDLDERVFAVISQSFEQWRCKQQHVMRIAYEDFVSARKHLCEQAWRSAAHQGKLPIEIQSKIAAWHSQEMRALECCYTEWEAVERKSLGDVFAQWKKEWRRLMTAEHARFCEETRSQAQQELEQWKKEQASLMADFMRASDASSGELRVLRQELCEVKLKFHQTLESYTVSEKRCKEQTVRATRAEADLAACKKEATAVGKKRPVFSTRGQKLAKRLRIERDTRLRGFDGTLFEKINEARDAGIISWDEASDMHDVRKEGNLAAHEKPGFFGTQIEPWE
eukprot:TRINITY_DN50880_c0_g1_i1.p1 TRINITY_DN50880_c0_g1~~TRINITY_DN50880_c0_g1_i1.p1  ORF type:complete len:443 (-),score=76.97 TRINITY_DN50880_c0_g1_i1:208-1536(-)